ncbi:MAG TPA: hypothetical protein ENJ97_00125 [Planctomycetes bacterium]|nr:hypothetical protein [Planctomycetota bacterium]
MSPEAKPSSGGEEGNRGRSLGEREEREERPGKEREEGEETSGEGKYFVSLRYGRMRHRGTFVTRDASLSPGDWVQARTPRGVEPALVISLPRTQPLPTRGGWPEEDRQVSGEVYRKLRPFEVDPPWEESGRLSAAYYVGLDMIRSLGLPMKLTSVEVLPRREKAIFYFLADGRVDFRQLVRNLARALKIRVEMKQIGVRDEARLKGTCGHCGLPLCCGNWIRKMAPVNMKMAKTQKTTLDPDKISGRCGRLLCCLRYEEEVYKENRKSLPQRNTWVQTPSGAGRVVGHEVLMCRVRVVLQSGEVQVFPLEEVRSIPQPSQEAPAAGAEKPAQAAPAREGKPRGTREGKGGRQPGEARPGREGRKVQQRKKKAKKKRRPGKGSGQRRRPGPPSHPG